MTDMTIDVFANHPSGRAALAKMAPVTDNFRLYEAGIMDSYGTMLFKGAEFRAAKSGPNKGVLSILVPGTIKSVFVSRSEIEAQTIQG